MRFRSRILVAVMALLLVPAFAQVLAARVLLRCADGRECFLPPHEIELECVAESPCCGGEDDGTPIVPDDTDRPCVWMVVPGLDLNHSIHRSPIPPPELLTIAASHVSAAMVSFETQCVGRTIEHVPIDRPQEILPGEGVGPRSPPRLQSRE